MEEADGSVLFIRGLDHDSALLESAYAAARVLALPSMVEIPGLAALEGGLAGCQLAVTGVGVAREYFGDHAQYLDPQSLASVRETVIDCYNNGGRRNTALQEHVKEHFLWEKVVRANLDGYATILHSRSQQR